MTKLVKGITPPDIVVAFVDILPGGQLSFTDVGTDAVEVRSHHQLPAEVDPLALATAPKKGGHGQQRLARVGFDVTQHVHHGVMDEHIAIRVIGTIDFADAHAPFSFFHVLTEDFESVHYGRVSTQQLVALSPQLLLGVGVYIFVLLFQPGLCRPDFQQLASRNGLFHAVGGKGLEFDVLHLGDALVACLVLPGVTREGVHVVQPPECRHHLQLVRLRVVADKRERQLDVKL